MNARRILVVGGSAGIGLAVARRQAALGARIAIAGRDAEKGEAAARALGQAVFLPCDAGDPAACEAMVEEARAKLGAIDALVSCAGGNPRPRLLADIPLADLVPTIERSLAPTILPMRAVLPTMTQAGSGAIVALASDAGKLATPGEVAIGAAMAGIAMFCRAMALEAKRHGIRVNCVTPSIVEGTDLHDDLMADPFAAKLFGKAKSMASLGIVQADEVAGLVSFLICEESAKITGQTVSITGGISTI